MLARGEHVSGGTRNMLLRRGWMDPHPTTPPRKGALGGDVHPTLAQTQLLVLLLLRGGYASFSFP